MKDLVALTYVLGLEVSPTHVGLMFCQYKYTKDLVQLANLFDDKMVHTPTEINSKYKKNDDEPLMDATLYWRLIGSLIELTTTRPDISYIV